MRLYCVQERSVYDTLAAGHPYIAYPRLDPQHWLNNPEGRYLSKRPNMTLYAYDWLCGQMELRGLARPSPDAYPVWAYQQWGGRKRPRPDLRFSSMKRWSAGGRYVLLDLEVPENDVLLSDYDAWHGPLNYWYLGRPRESNGFERKCRALKLSHYRTKPLPNLQLHDELVSSWQRIFDLELAQGIVGGKKSDQTTQATFWRLEPKHVVRAVEFGAGQAKRELLALNKSSPYTTELQLLSSRTALK
jgi:Domain of unknown function (DUF3841)